MNHEYEEFWVKRSKKEAEEFLARILDSLLDYLSEMEEECSEVQHLKPQRINENQKIFLSHYRLVMWGLQHLENNRQPFDEKYAIAIIVQENLMGMELHSCW